MSEREKPGGYGRYADDPACVGCPRAASDMTPCVARDGHTALGMTRCVGCGSDPRRLLEDLRKEVFGRATPTTKFDASADKLRDLVREVTDPAAQDYCPTLPTTKPRPAG